MPGDLRNFAGFLPRYALALALLAHRAVVLKYPRNDFQTLQRAVALLLVPDN